MVFCNCISKPNNKFEEKFKKGKMTKVKGKR